VEGESAPAGVASIADELSGEKLVASPDTPPASAV
jgi:hypothetical protein